MREDYLLPTENARRLYAAVKDCPIYDYHCHLSPMEIWEDRKFDNIGEMWLAHDHYKWRLMRAAGIPESLITGDASWHDKFLAYMKAISTAAGNPLYHWTQMELSRYFGVEISLSPDTAEEIWTLSNKSICDRNLSPKKLIESSGVVFIATTDDAADSLEYHKKLREDKSFAVTVTPSFRVDNALLLLRDGYTEYITKLSEAAKIRINNYDSFKEALLRRLDDFETAGCRLSDVGITYFPEAAGSRNSAEDTAGAQRAFYAAVNGDSKHVDIADYYAFLRETYLFLGEEYKRRGIVMQLHMAVQRNVNTPLLESCGEDSGGDCIGDPISGVSICGLLDAMHRKNSLPETILYTLNPSMTAQLCSIAGSFPNVRVGAAWWFNDHKRGITDVIKTVAEISHIDSFLGMLTDSRSFLSYARHDYFRRILCSVLAEWEDRGEFSGDTEKIARNICFGNIKRLLEKRQPQMNIR